MACGSHGRPLSLAERERRRERERERSQARSGEGAKIPTPKGAIQTDRSAAEWGRPLGQGVVRNPCTPSKQASDPRSHSKFWLKVLNVIDGFDGLAVSRGEWGNEAPVLCRRGIR